MLIISPLRVWISKRKQWTLNLNTYRNSFHMVLNKSKQAYKSEIREQIENLGCYDKIEIHYTLYPKTKRLTDISNVLSIHDKYFCDSLVSFGKLPDDNYNYISKVTYEMGEVDKLNCRVEIEITEVGGNSVL